MPADLDEEDDSCAAVDAAAAGAADEGNTMKEGEIMHDEPIEQLGVATSHLHISEESSLTVAKSGAIRCYIEEASTADAANNPSELLVFGDEGPPRNVDELVQLDVKEKTQDSTRTSCSRATKWQQTVFYHQIGVPLSQGQSRRNKYHNFYGPDRTALQCISSLYVSSIDTFDGMDLCSSLESNLANVFDERSFSLSSLELDRRVDLHHSFPSRSNGRVETANNAAARRLYDVNNLLSSQHAFPTISESMAPFRHASNHRSISRSSSSDMRHHSSRTERGSSIDSDMISCSVRSSRRSDTETIAYLAHNDFDGIKNGESVCRSSSHIDETGEKLTSRDKEHPSERNQGCAMRPLFTKQSPRQRKAKKPKPSSHTTEFDPVIRQENVSASQNTSTLDYLNAGRKTREPKSKRKNRHGTSKGQTACCTNSEVLGMLLFSKSSIIDNPPIIGQEHFSEMKRGESACHSIDETDRKSTSDVEPSVTRFAPRQPFNKSSPRQQKTNRRKSLNHAAETDPLKNQEHSSARQSATLVYLNAGRKHLQHPKSRRKQRGPSTEQDAHYASNERTSTDSNSNRDADMPMPVLQTDPFDPGIIHQHCPNMNPSPPHGQPTDKERPGLNRVFDNITNLDVISGLRPSLAMRGASTESDFTRLMPSSSFAIGSTNDYIDCWYQIDFFGVMNEESVLRINDTGEKPRSDNVSNDTQGILAINGRLVKDSPRQRKAKKRKSSSHIAETDPLSSQENSSARQNATLAYRNAAGRNHQHQPKSRRKQRGTSREQDAYCASTESSSSNNDVDMLTPVLQTDPFGSRTIQQNCCPNMHSSHEQQPRDVDVIFGRGKAANQHNESFREQVGLRHVDYLEGNDARKTELVAELIRWVRNRGGRFLKKDSTGWVERNDPAVNDKVRQSLRDYNRNNDADMSTSVLQTEPCGSVTNQQNCTNMNSSPTDVDVICGRGKAANQHNESFREQVGLRHLDYLQGTDMRKTELVAELIRWVQNRGGRFLTRSKEVSTDWLEINESSMNNKIRQSLRDYNSTSNTKSE